MNIRWQSWNRLVGQLASPPKTVLAKNIPVEGVRLSQNSLGTSELIAPRQVGHF